MDSSFLSIYIPKPSIVTMVTDSTYIIFSSGIKIVRPDLIYLKYSIRPDQILHDRIFRDSSIVSTLLWYNLD